MCLGHFFIFMLTQNTSRRKTASDLWLVFRHRLLVDSHYFPDGKIHTQVHSFSDWGIYFEYVTALLFFFYSFEMAHRAHTQTAWFQIWQKVLQNFWAELHCTDIHSSYWKLEKLLLTQTSAGFQLWYFFIEGIASYIFIYFHASYCDFSFILNCPLFTQGRTIISEQQINLWAILILLFHFYCWHCQIFSFLQIVKSSRNGKLRLHTGPLAFLNGIGCS